MTHQSHISMFHIQRRDHFSWKLIIKSAWWLLMAWCRISTRASATIMMTDILHQGICNHHDDWYPAPGHQQPSWLISCTRASATIIMTDTLHQGICNHHNDRYPAPGHMQPSWWLIPCTRHLQPSWWLISYTRASATIMMTDVQVVFTFEKYFLW